MRLTPRKGVLFTAIILLLDLDIGRSAVRLDALGLYLTRHGYGGAQLVHIGNFYHLPIQSNGKPGNLIVDTGSPATLIFRSSLKRLNLTESKTTEHVSGAYGSARDVYGLTTIKALAAGNCTLSNVPVVVASEVSSIQLDLTHSNGLLGLRELIKFGAVLDFRNHLIYLRPSRPGDSMAATIKSILSQQGYSAVPLLPKNNHLYTAGGLNGVPCHFLVDTGSDVTTVNTAFAARAKLKVNATPLVGVGFGGSSPAGITTFLSLRIGNYEIRNGSASVERLSSPMLEANSGIAGCIGAEYLAINRAIFDFVSGTLYLTPPAR